jgi:hypothetical protein
LAAEYKNAPDSVKVQNQSLYSHQSNPPVSISQAVDSGNYTQAIRTDSLPGGFYKLYTVVNSDTLYDDIWVFRQ